MKNSLKLSIALLALPVVGAGLAACGGTSRHTSVSSTAAPGMCWPKEGGVSDGGAWHATRSMHVSGRTVTFESYGPTKLAYFDNNDIAHVLADPAVIVDESEKHVRIGVRMDPPLNPYEHLVRVPRRGLVDASLLVPDQLHVGRHTRVPEEIVAPVIWKQQRARLKEPIGDRQLVEVCTAQSDLLGLSP